MKSEIAPGEALLVMKEGVLYALLKEVRLFSLLGSTLTFVA